MSKRFWWMPDNVEPQQIIDLYNQGNSITTIFKMFEFTCEKSTLTRWLRGQGIQLRARGIQHKDVTCDGCGKHFIIRALNSNLCLTCAPDKTWSSRFYNYKITRPQFYKMLENQLGLCDLCSLPLPLGNVSQIRIDHCHKTNQIRGLIHNKCNIGLHYIEDEKFLINAKAYVERHRAGG